MNSSNQACHINSTFNGFKGYTFLILSFFHILCFLHQNQALIQESYSFLSIFFPLLFTRVDHLSFIGHTENPSRVCQGSNKLKLCWFQLRFLVWSSNGFVANLGSKESVCSLLSLKNYIQPLIRALQMAFKCEHERYLDGFVQIGVLVKINWVVHSMTSLLC